MVIYNHRCGYLFNIAYDRPIFAGAGLTADAPGQSAAAGKDICSMRCV